MFFVFFFFFFFLMIRRPPRSTPLYSSAASDVYKRQVKGYANTICILHNGSVIATYPRYYGSGNTQYRLEHYLDLLERKPRSVFNARPVKENVTKELLDWGSHLPGGN